MKKIALVGNQNSGKTTLFNKLTGSHQHVGNFPGVTIERKEGQILSNKDLLLVDLPGIYSLSPYSADEIVTRDFIINEKPDLIINIVDGTNIERNLYLTTQILSLNVPTILALNMIDELKVNGTEISIPTLEDELSIKVVPISASLGEGIDELVDAVKTALCEDKKSFKYYDLCEGDIHTAVHALIHVIEENANRAKLPLRFAAEKLIEGDKIVTDALSLSEDQQHIFEHLVEQMESKVGLDAEAAIIEMRYSYIERAIKASVIKRGTNVNLARSQKIDRILTHKYFGIPIFLAIMGLIFYLTFDLIGGNLSNLLALGIESLTNAFDALLTRWEISAWLHSLLIDGVFAGVGSVLEFLPIIVILFLFLSLLEDSGYMARVAFVMDKLLRKIGLSGKSFVPMLIGFGCSVPAVMATRTISSEKDRKMTILLIPNMSCSAKLPIYSLFVTAFFDSNRALVMIGLYVIGMLVGVLYGLLLKNTKYKGKSMPFMLELPSYRLPSFKTALLLMWERAKEFLKKAFTVIFLATLVIWFLQSFDVRFNLTDNPEISLLGGIGKLIAPVFAPLGFGDWRIVSAIITGLSAKEAVVSTLNILLAASGVSLSSLFTPISAFSFLLFTLLYMPCFAAVATIKKEFGSGAKAALAMLCQTALAYVVALLFYQTAMLFV